MQKISTNFKFIRFWIILSSILGIFATTILSGIYFSYVGYPSSSLAISSYSDLASVKIVFLLLVTFAFFATVICNVGLIRFAKNSTDDELCANKWSLSVLSLTIGGFFTPFILTSLPNADSKGTKNARITIVRYFGTSILAGATAGIAAIIYFYFRVQTRAWEANSKSTFFAIVGILATIVFLSLLFVSAFYSHQINDNIMANNGYGKWLRFIATVYTVLVTILLVIQIILALLRLVEAIARIFTTERKGGLGLLASLFDFAWLGLVIFSTLFMIHLLTSVIKGLWSRKEGYVVHIPQYKKGPQVNYSPH